MATNTTNYKLNIPSQDDFYNVEDFNANFEILDAAVASKVNNSQVLTNVPANAKFTDTTYSEITTSEIDAGTASTLRTMTGRRAKYILDKSATMISTAVSGVTKSSIGLGNVTNDKQATKVEVDELNSAIEQNAENLDSHKSESVLSGIGVHGLDIKSGTWEAIVRGGHTAGTATYALRDCTYYRIGNLVLTRFTLNVTVIDSEGNIEITGLPFSSKESPCVGVIGFATIDGVYTDIATFANLGDPSDFRLIKSNKQYVTASEINSKKLYIVGQIIYEV